MTQKQAPTGQVKTRHPHHNTPNHSAGLVLTVDLDHAVADKLLQAQQHTGGQYSPRPNVLGSWGAANPWG